MSLISMTLRSAEDEVPCRGAGPRIWEMQERVPAHNPSSPPQAASRRLVTTSVRNRTTKDIKLPPIVLLILSLVIFASAFGYTIYRRQADKRTVDKKRNQYNDRA